MNRDAMIGTFALLGYQPYRFESLTVLSDGHRFLWISMLSGKAMKSESLYSHLSRLIPVDWDTFDMLSLIKMLVLVQEPEVEA